ncbi:MAG: hypothetical protein ABJN36_02360 [Cyclobacteriaceae bacterium]
MSTLLLNILLIITNLGFPLENSYRINFKKIDNRAKVYVADSLVYDSETIDGNPGLDIMVNLTPHLIEGKNQIKVELYNGSGEGFESFDEKWEIFYEILENDFPIDFLTEKSSNGKEGLVLSMTHEIDAY